MAVSYLKEIVKKIAQDKKLDWTNSKDKAIWSADKSLDRGEIDIDKAMDVIRDALHDDWKSGKISNDDFRKIEKEIKYKLNK
jgi:hypothetical protein